MHATNCCSAHLECLGQSVRYKFVKCSKGKILHLNTLTLEKEDYVFGCEITVGELEQALMKVSLRNSSGPDSTVPEHLKFGRQMLVIWLKKSRVRWMKFNLVSNTPLLYLYSRKGQGFSEGRQLSWDRLNYCKALGIHYSCPLATIPGRVGSAFTNADSIQKNSHPTIICFTNLEAMSHYLTRGPFK